MKYLKKIENHTDYDNAKNSLILPNVSFCGLEKDIHYKQFNPCNGHEYVEIGGVKWATMNLGATTITDNGFFFQWGDTQGYTADQVGSGEGKKAFAWADYKFNPSGDGSTMTKYNSTDGKTRLELVDDAARTMWEGEWRLPTAEELTSLQTGSTSAWTNSYNDSGVPGVILTSKTDQRNKIFLPAGGDCSNGVVGSVGNLGCYWVSDVEGNKTSGRRFWFDGGGITWNASWDRYYGFKIRPVVSW